MSSRVSLLLLGVNRPSSARATLVGRGLGQAADLVHCDQRRRTTRPPSRSWTPMRASGRPRRCSPRPRRRPTTTVSTSSTNAAHRQRRSRFSRTSPACSRVRSARTATPAATRRCSTPWCTRRTARGGSTPPPGVWRVNSRGLLPCAVVATAQQEDSSSCGVCGTTQTGRARALCTSRGAAPPRPSVGRRATRAAANQPGSGGPIADALDVRPLARRRTPVRGGCLLGGREVGRVVRRREYVGAGPHEGRRPVRVDQRG